MSIYVVQASGTELPALEKARFIRDGFSLPAFVFGLFWLLYRRLWLPALGYVVYEVAFLLVVAPHLSAAAVMGANLIVRLYLGSEGNRWRQAKGARRSAVEDVVEARDRDQAEAIFFARHVGSQAGPDAGPVRGSPA